MQIIDYLKELDAAVTVCDQDGIILYLNDKAARMFEKSGGIGLVGKNLLDCHPEPAKSKLHEMLKTKLPNTYTIEKNGIKKIIVQKPWFEGGIFKGLIEIASEIPFDMPHFVRK